MFNRSFSFVIPAYNEQDNIQRAVDSAFEFLSKNFSRFEIVIVDDGSTDTTQAACEQILSRYGENVRVLRHDRNCGYGAALRSGLFSTKGDLVFYTDSDNQFDINEIMTLMPFIDDFDMVIGYRKERKDVFVRKFSSRVFNRLIFLIFGLDVKDIDCSFKLFRRESLHQVSIETDEFLVDTELLVKAKRKNLRIKELPVTHFPRKAGKSTVQFRHIFSSLRDICFLYKRLRKENDGVR